MGKLRSAVFDLYIQYIPVFSSSKVLQNTFVLGRQKCYVRSNTVFLSTTLRHKSPTA